MYNPKAMPTFPTPAFVPHPLLRSGQLQTLAGQLLAAPPKLLNTRDETIGLPDGDRLVLRINQPAHEDPGKPLVLMLHGLGGCSESTYLLRLANKLTRLGYTSLRFNHRGCGPGAETLARQIYHAGRTADLATTLAYIEKRWPGRDYCVAAFSLSGNLLLRYLGMTETRSAHPHFARALAVCPPIDLEACSKALAAPHNRHIDLYYTRQLLATARTKSRLFPADGPLRLPRRLNLRLFDELYTAPRAGFKNREAYYTASSAKQSVHLIKTPTLVLAAADDPIIPKDTFAKASFSAAVTLRIEQYGGHMGFIAAARTAFGDRRWMDEAVITWAGS